MTIQVFVSYSRKDFDFVKSIVAFLEQQFVVWWDDDIVGGTDFATDIFKKIEKTQVAVVVWSANAATSKWVRNESQAAVGRSTCIPILLDGTPLPPHLAHLDAIDLRTWDGRSENRELRKLAQDITLHLAHATKPTGEDIAQLVPKGRAARQGGIAAVAFCFLLMMAILGAFLSFYDGQPAKLDNNEQERPRGDTRAAFLEATGYLPWRRTDQANIQNPPFIIEYPAESESDWGQQTRELLRENKYDDAHLLLERWEAKDPAARNLRAVLDVPSDPSSAFRNFRIAASEGNLSAKANLGICSIFGIGTSVDPTYGGELLKQSIQEGLDPAKATWLLSNGLSSLQTDNYAEVIKSIHLEATKGEPIALTIEGVLATKNLAKEPCAPKCLDRAKAIVVQLKTNGQYGLAALVEANGSFVEHVRKPRSQDPIQRRASTKADNLDRMGNGDPLARESSGPTERGGRAPGR
jgi:TPR repeat protein